MITPTETSQELLSVTASLEKKASLVEVLKDVVFRVAPIPKTEAQQMVNEIKALAILKGTRGAKPIDFDSLYSAISNISRLVFDFPQIQELDANPISVSSTGLYALDARIVLKSTD